MAGIRQAAALCAALLHAALSCHANAQVAPRAWVSGHGADAAGCGAPTNPCRSFQYTHDHIVAAGGEIDILDPAGYGAITINKSISIINEGVGEAGVQALSGATAITINAGPTDVINLRGLTVAGNGSGGVGILFSTGAELNAQNCVVRGFASAGLGLYPAADAVFNIQDTVVSDNPNFGVGLTPSGTGRVTAVLTRVSVTGAEFGIDVDGSGGAGVLSATISDSLASDNVVGVAATSPTGDFTTKLMVFNSVVANNRLFGLNDTGASALTDLSRSALSGNASAYGATGGGLIYSSGDNDIFGNGFDGGALQPLSPK